eukprot:EC693000.1.p3 GENE.EC693000.1~~EC693000.1.p3  ORF type:complete len:67 (-),score=5.52 EC693000.1:404-604(-)
MSTQARNPKQALERGTSPFQKIHQSPTRSLVLDAESAKELTGRRGRRVGNWWEQRGRRDTCPSQEP